MNIYVGNLSKAVSEDDLRTAFESFGEISSIRIIKDRYTGESKGFGFVEMPAKQEAESAMQRLNASEIKGKTVTVNEAKPRTDSNRSFGGARRSGTWQNRS